MNEVLKENDILLATILKPDISNIDLFKNNITLENTLLLSKDQYKGSPLIKNAFSKDGVFDEGLFDLAYNLAAVKYLLMQEDLLMNDFINNLEYSKTSFFREPRHKTYSTEYKGINIANPLQQAVGLEGINVKSEATKTEKEVAQSHNIWDPKNKTWLDESAESRNIFQKAFGESLIYAKYTKDGYQENPITKEVDYHSAGEFIKDDEGNYFTQLADNSDLTNNVEIVKLQDILSSEDSWWNKIDFYDSDSREKSIPGVVMKTLALTIPYFIPYLGPVYTTAAVLVGLGENLPQIAKSFDWSPEGSAFSKGCNSVVNWFSKLSPSTSQYGQEHFWSIENLGTLTADIVGLLYQLRGLASLSQYLTKTNTYRKELELAAKTASYGDALLKYTAAAEQQAKIAKALSLGYMSLVQAGDVYNDALNAGYSRGVAGVATLMSTAAFFGIMNYNESLNGLGTWFLDKTTGYDREILRSPVSKFAKSQVKEALQSPEMQKIVKEGGNNFGSKMRNHWLNFWSKVDDAVRIGSEGAWTGAIAEGVEEVSEEVVQDGVKGIIDGLNYLGYKSGKWGNENASFGGWSNVFSQEGLLRYLETFVGGAMGGAMFHVTQNKIKPFTDSLFGIDSEVQKPIEYDKIDIALLGKEDQYYQEIDKAVKFIDDRELDLGNPEDAKIYRAREAIATNLKNEMKAIVDVVRSITAGADFSTIPQNFREAVQKSFKPLINSSGAIDYIDSKWKYTVGQLANVLLEIKSREKDLETNREGIDVEKTKELIKQKKEEAQLLRELVTGYFTGKSYINTHDEASWLANRDLLKAISGSLTPQEYYENILKVEGGPEYKDLVESSADPNKLSKELVAKQAEAFNKELENQFDSSLLPDLYLRLPIINKAFKSLARLIGSDINLYLNDERKSTVVTNTIKKMQQDRDLQIQQIEAMDLMELLTPESRKKYDAGNEEEKAKILADAKLDILQQINEAFSIPKLMELLKNDPNAFSLSDRRNIDYTKILEDKGIIKLYDKLTEEQKTVLRTLINSEFANVPLSTLSKQNVQTILDNIQGKLSSKDGYWGDLFLKAANLEESAEVDAVPNLLTFDINLDKFDDSVEFIKLKDIEDFLSLDSEYISKELYDFLLEQYKRLDAEFLSKLRGLDSNGELDSIIDQYLENPTTNNQKELVNFLKDTLSVDADLLSKIVDKLGILEEEPQQQIDSIINTVNTNLRTANLIERYKGTELVENNFLKALDKVAFNIVGDPKIVREISKLVADWEKSLKANLGLQINSNLSKEALDHLHNVLAVLSTVVSTMTSKQDGDSKMESIQERNQNFAKAMGLDGSEYYVLGESEGDLMQTMIGEMNHKISMLKTVQGSIDEELYVKFETVRKQVLDNQFKLFRYHLARKDDPLYIQEIAEEIEAEENVELPDLEKLKRILKYQQAIYNRLLDDNFGGDLFKENYLSRFDSKEKALVAFFIDTYGTENGKIKDDIFYIGDPATVANNQLDSNATYASYFLTELVGLVGLDNNHSPKVIQDALHKAFTDLGLYPRLDLIYNLQLITYGIIGKSAYSEFGKSLEGLYNNPNTRGATKQYINNLIKVFGPAGSGKTALYSALIKALEHLGYNKESLPIAITALSEYKVANIQTDLSKSELKEIHYSPLYNIISNLKTKSANWKVLETKLISRLVDLDLRNKIISGEITSIQLDSSDNKYGVLQIEVSSTDDIFIKLSGAKEELSDFEVQLTISKDQLKDSGSFAGNLRFTFTGKSFEGLDISGTSLNNGLLIIDECTNLSPFEWLALNKLSTDKNFSILATGDSYQRGYQYDYYVGKSLRKAYIGDENILGLNAPALVSVHRALSSATQNNEENIRKIADIAISSAKNNSHEGLSDYEFTTQTVGEIEKLLKSLKLEYTLDNDSYGFLGANIVSTQLDLQKTIENIKDKNKTFLIITNSSTDNTEGILNILTAQGFKPENIKIVSKEDVQGAEADYAIAFNISPSNSILSDLKEIYTLVTRGRYGFISFGTNDLFTTKGVSSTADKPVIIISKNSETDRQAKNWLDIWKLAIDSTDGSRPEKTKEERIPDNPPGDEPEPENPEEREKKTTKNISEAFKDSDWLIGRLYGYMLGLSLNQINSIKDRSRTEWQSEVGGTSFGAFLRLLDSGSSLVWKDDQVEISDILKRVQPIGNLGKDYIDSYIKFINIVRESYSNSKIKGLSFLKLSAYGEGVAEDNPNIPYLKYNDDPKQARGELRTFGIPIFTDGNISGHVILGVLGYDVDEEGNSSVKNTLWYNYLVAGSPIFKVVTNDKEKLSKHNTNLESYHQKAGHRTEISSRAKTHNGAVASITNLRDWSIVTDWQGNISQEELKLGRMSVLELLDSGFEFVEGQPFNGGKGTNFGEFIKWYNSYRWSDVSKDKESQFESIIGHNGKYFVVRPRGTSGKGFPILVKAVIPWDNFIDSGKTKLSGAIDQYTAVNIIYAAAKYGLQDSDFTYSSIKTLLLDDSRKAEIDKLFNDLVNSDKLKGYISFENLNILRNCILAGDSNREFSKLASDNRYTPDSFKHTQLFTWLDLNAKDFPYMNVQSSNVEPSYIVERVFEPDNVLIDLSLLVDPQELQSSSNPEIQVVEWGNGLSEAESSELNKLFNGILSGNLFTVNAFNNRTTVRRNIAQCILLLDKMSREDILNLDSTLSKNLLNIINILLNQDLNGRLTESLQKIKSKIESDKDISILCSI